MTTFHVSAADLIRAGDVLLAAFRGDVEAGSAKRLGYPVTCWPVPGGIQLGAQMSGGAVSLVIPADVEGEDVDEFSFPLAAIRDSKAALGKRGVRLVLDGNTFRVEAAGATLAPPLVQGIARQPKGEFLAPDPDRLAAFSLDTAALPWVAAALADDDARPVLTRVHCRAAEPGADAVTLVAADGFRLHEAAALATVDRWDGWDSDAYVSLPGWLVAAIGKLRCQSVDIRAGWWQDGRHECLASWDAAVSLRASWMPVGAPPDFRVVFGSVLSEVAECTGKMADLADALTVLGPVARQGANIFRVVPGDGSLALESTVAEVGTVRRDVPVTGQGLRFAANVTYWLDALGKPKNGAAFTLAFDPRMVKADGGFSSPIRLVTEQPFGEALSVIMPMHIAR